MTREPRVLNEGTIVSSTKGVGKQENHMQNNKTGTLIKDFNTKPETINFPEENIREMLLDIALVIIFLDMT